MADVTAGAARQYASAAEVRADVERAGGDASALCRFGRCLCIKTALGVSGRKERGHWPRFQESECSNRVLLAPPPLLHSTAWSPVQRTRIYARRWSGF